MALIRCPKCNELTVRGQPVEWSPLWEFECRNGHVWREAGRSEGEGRAANSVDPGPGGAHPRASRRGTHYNDGQAGET